MTDLAAFSGEREQLLAEVAHWNAVARRLTDLEAFAAPAAWASLERYLDVSLRARLEGVARSVALEAAQLRDALAEARTVGDLVAVRRRTMMVRQRYLRAETVIEFYGDAVNTRTNPRLAGLLRGLDVLAGDSMDIVLRPLGIETPPVLTYLDKGLGASILRAGVRLWDAASPSPTAAIKLTRHNLFRPTSLIHETGHQVSHLTNWNSELADALAGVMRPVSSFAASAWRSWASEVAADVYAFVLLGYAPTPALANVVDGPTPVVFRIREGDPHPFGWIRVMFNIELCRSWFGAGPWDELAQAWVRRHPLDNAPRESVALVRASALRLRELADVCTRAPMRAFRGQPLSALADPMRVRPAELRAFADRAGASLLTSSHLQRREPMRILAWLTLDGLDVRHEATAAANFERWVSQLGAQQPLAA
jgi:hypothetical protein